MPTATSSRWHLSPTTGKQARCKAQVCPFGGDHWASEEEAKAALELRVAAGDFIKPKSRQPDRYTCCSKCGTEERSRLVYDRSRSTCNACYVYATMLSRVRNNSEIALKKKVKRLQEKEAKLAAFAPQSVASDQARLNKLKELAQHDLFLAETELQEIKVKEFDFTSDEFVAWRSNPTNHGNANGEGGQCAYCGVSDFELHKAGYFNARSSADGNYVDTLGIDRIDSSGQYTLANMQVCCYGCNTIKGGSTTHEEMLELAPALTKRTAKRVAQYDAAATA